MALAELSANKMRAQVQTRQPSVDGLQFRELDAILPKHPLQPPPREDPGNKLKPSMLASRPVTGLNHK